MAFFGFTLGAAGASGSVATAVAVGAPAVDAEAAGADAGVAGGFAAGAGVVAGAFATGAAGVSVDEVAAAGEAAAGEAVGFVAGVSGAFSSGINSLPFLSPLNYDNSNPTTPRNQATSAALAQHRLEPAFPARREQSFDHAAGGGGKILGVAVPPRFRKSR